MNTNENILEFNIIREKLMNLAYTPSAKEKIKALQPYLSELELRKNMRESGEARSLIERAGNPPMSSMEGMMEMVEIAHIGGCLSAEQLEQAENIMTSVKRLKEYLDSQKYLELGITFYGSDLNSLDEFRSEVHHTIREGEVDDFASKLLRSLRSSIAESERKMREKAESVMKSQKECMSDHFCTMRNGHICIPVKKDYKFKIKGSVMDTSATGSTLFIEPASVSKLYDGLQLLRLDEENEVRRILYVLTGMLADAFDLCERNQKTIEKLDFMFAKGRFSIELDAVEPRINTERNFRLTKARHPLMDKNTSVPLDLELGIEGNGIVITGPNTGGKTVAIKTVALNCLMAQCGLHVTCESADICMNAKYLSDIGDGQNIAENLSTFSAHIKNVMSILNNADNESLIIMDELGSGTDPTEGMGIAIAVLKELKKSGALYLVTTHYPEVKNYAEREEGVVNARMTFDRESIKPTYQLVIGEAGESCALYIAERLGMPSRMLENARQAAYGITNAYSANDAYSANGKPIETARRAAGISQKPSSIKRMKEPAAKDENNSTIEFQRGDSVMVLPDQKIGIVCECANEKGILRVQLPGKKISISHKRLQLLVPASSLYPQDYDFSIIFDSVETRKMRHQMSRKYEKDQRIDLESEY
ncbi:MAG: endonuclease MutS2 [Lachnospiraceae bacterium]